MTGFATDLKLLARDRFAVLALIGFLVCALIAGALGASWAVQHDAMLATFAADKRFRVEGSSIAPTDIERAIVQPAAPLLALTTGRTDLEPSYASTSFFAREDKLFSDYQIDAPLLLAAGRFDLAFVVVWLAPLLLIALGLGIVGSDRDSGLLRMQLAAARGIRGNILGRAALRLVLVLAPVALVACAVAATGSAEALGCLPLWLGVALGYLLVWQGIILCVSTLRLRQEALGAALLGIWALLVLIVPAFGAATAQALYPTPSHFALIAEARAVEVAARAAAPDLLNRYMTDHPELVADSNAKVEKWMTNMAMANSRVEAAVRPTLTAFETARAKQRRVAARFELLSPALLTHRLLADAAGSGEAAHAAFRAAARQFHRNVNSALTRAGLKGETLSLREAAAVPRFAVVASDDRGTTLAALLLIVAGLGIGSFAARRLTAARLAL